MFSFVTAVWAADDNLQSQHAAMINKRLSKLPQWHCAQRQPGFAVWFKADRAASIECIRLADGAGVIFGNLYARSGDPLTASIATLDAGQSAAIANSGGRHLMSSYWGRYIAFLRPPGRSDTWVVRDPLGGINCFSSRFNGGHLYFSDVEDCATLRLIDFTIDWRYIAMHTVIPSTHIEQTGLTNVRELRGGFCDHIEGAGSDTHCYWNPTKFATEHPIEDITTAAAQLRDTTRFCIHAWASKRDNILVLLSGGLDSSIVLGCLHEAPSRPRISCLTQYSPDFPEGDERGYARLIADEKGYSLLTAPTHLDTSFATITGIARSARPSHYLGCLHEREIVGVARAQGAGAIYSGEMGDEIFYEQHGHSTADYLLRHGVTSALFSILRDSASLEKRSIWRVASAAWKARRGGAHFDTLAPWLGSCQLVSQQAIDLTRAEADKLRSPWLLADPNLPPGKQVHIAMLAGSMNLERPLRQPGDPEDIPVLASQPLVELCLRMPTYLLNQGGRTRAVARLAFRADVPADILRRTDKGDLRRYTAAVMRSEAQFARELLIDGELTSRGLLNRAQLAVALSGQPSEINPTELMRHLSTEIWLRRWGLNQRSAAAA